MIGTKVYGIDGPGQRCRDDLAGSVGVIVAEESNMFGDMWLVEWKSGPNAGRQEPFYKHQIKHVSEQKGIGVYHE
jgi:hypothetical protein